MEASNDDKSGKPEKVPRTPEQQLTRLELIKIRLELYGLPVVLLGVGIAFMSWRNETKHEDRAVAERAYDRADEAYSDYLKLCVEQPALECYHGARRSTQFTEDERRAQFVLDTILIDVFEVAYTSYNGDDYAATASYACCRQWPGWVAGMRQAAQRQHFRDAWREMQLEFDENYRKCMNEVVNEGEAGKGYGRLDEVSGTHCYDARLMMKLGCLNPANAGWVLKQPKPSSDS